MREALRVLRPGGLLLAAAISRFALLLDGVRHGYFGDAEAAQVIVTGVQTGENRRPSLERFPYWFTTSHLHQPADLAAEIVESGFHLAAILGIEGPGGFIGDGWDDPAQRPYLLRAARLVEQEESLLGLSAHLLAVARKGH